MTRIIIDNDYGTYSVEEKKEGLSIYEMIDLFERALLAVSFHPNTIKKGIIEKAEEYEIQEKNNEL